MQKTQLEAFLFKKQPKLVVARNFHQTKGHNLSAEQMFYLFFLFKKDLRKTNPKKNKISQEIVPGPVPERHRTNGIS